MPDLVAGTLAQLGVGHVFGVVGSGNFELVNALRARDVPFTASRHEGGAATMADAYSRVSGRLGVVSTHQGCGYTNALTGIAEAAKSRTPLLVLTAAAPAAALANNFQMDQDAAARSVGAVADRVHSAATAVRDTARAWRTAMIERRAVVLSVPIDLLGASADDTSMAVRVPGLGDTERRASHRVERRGGRARAAELDALRGLLAAAERPVFIAGRGAREAGHALAALAEREGALLATSAVAKGLFQGDAEGRAPDHGGFDLGISGGFATPVAAELIADADLVVAWGCALNDWTTRRGTLLGQSAALVQIDIESSALGAHRSIDLGIVGDCGSVAADLLMAPSVGDDGGDRSADADESQANSGASSIGADASPQAAVDSGSAPAPARRYRTREVAARIAREGDWRQVPYQDLGSTVAVDPRTVTIALDAALPRERTVAIDSGNFMGYPSQLLSVPDVAGFCFTQAFQSIGLGLATAIGAAVARLDRVPVLGTGDGGLHMAIAELETAVRLGIPLVVLAYNDASYSAEVHHFAMSPTPGGAGDFETVTFPDTDFAAIARGFGARGVTVRSSDDLEAMAEAARETASMGFGQGTPLVIDAKIASDGGSWWLAEAFSSH